MMERSTEEHPLLNPPTQDTVIVMEDINEVSTPTECHEALLHHQESSEYPLDQVMSDNGTNDPTCAQPMLPKSSNTVLPPAVTEKVTHDDIQGFQDQQVHVHVA